MPRILSGIAPPEFGRELLARSAHRGIGRAHPGITLTPTIGVLEPPPDLGWVWPTPANPEGGIMPITDTTVDMLTASGGTTLTGVIAVVLVVLGVLLRKQVLDFAKHVIDVIDDRTLAKDPERARIVAELRRARRGQK
jgi:hypothetical protein